MEIPENVTITITGARGGSLKIERGDKEIYNAEGINFNRARHWNPEENEADVKLSIDVLEAIAECTNYVGVSDAKLDRQ